MDDPTASGTLLLTVLCGDFDVILTLCILEKVFMSYFVFCY